MLKSLLFSLAVATFASGASAQCGTLTATGTGAAGTTLTLDLTGSTADSGALLAVGTTLGSTSFQFGPLGTLTFGLQSPFALLPLGMTDSNGDATLSINVPIELTQSVSLHGQAVTTDLVIGRGRPTFNFCVSNTAAFTLGGS